YRQRSPVRDAKSRRPRSVPPWPAPAVVAGPTPGRRLRFAAGAICAFARRTYILAGDTTRTGRMVDEAQQPQRAGPILHFRGMAGQEVRLAAIVIRPRDEPPPPPIRLPRAEIAPRRIAEIAQAAVWRHDFTLTPAEGGYEFEG